MNCKFVLVILLSFWKSSHGIWIDPDTGLNLFQFVDRYGYTFYENHTITTEDDYILTTVRIPRGKNETATNQTKPAVLLLHGIWSNPQDLIFKGDTSIGFMLAEEGYDVYLMASRGNTYSTGHKTFDADSTAYWNFSWHEVGYYDIPANMDYITNLTGNQNISFIGHSQGGTAFVAFAATRPEYRKRITFAHLFAPVVYMDYARIPFYKAIVEIEEDLETVFDDFQLNKGLFTYSQMVLPLGIIFCHRDSAIMGVCKSLLGLAGPNPTQLNSMVSPIGIKFCHRDSVMMSVCKPLLGLARPNPTELNMSRITVMATNDPAGGSFKQAFHYLQVAKSSEFRLYNYRTDNQLQYNQTEAPFYNLTSIDDIPLYVWYGLNDYFSGALDYKRLISEIPCATEKLVSNILWNHIDFIFANEAVHYVYTEAISLMNSYL